MTKRNAILLALGCSFVTDRPRAVLAAAGIDQLSKREAKATPLAFRDLLLSIACTSGQRT